MKVVCFDTKEERNVDSLKDAKKFIKEQLPGVDRIALIEGAYGYIVVEGTKKNPTGDSLGMIDIREVI